MYMELTKKTYPNLLLETNPTITGDGTIKSKLTIMVLTIIFLMNIYTRNNFSFFPSIGATRTFRFERPILPFADSHFIAATIVYTIRKFMPFSKELYLHSLGERSHSVSFRVH